MFYADTTGQVWRLDTGAAEAERVGTSQAAFDDLLGNRARADELLMAPVVQAFEELYGPLGAAQCLGFKSLPVLGGTYTAENRVALPICEHAAATGEMHRQIRDLPDGATVRVTVIP
ncbi:MAG: DUF1851 domain-containing protein [Gemmatimonadaceae bacterium]|nr:DUF1851 domain-containing protein [Gemmatimonadaceae bacterium]NUQ93320.1 DUF1851 domain-containing protein [Gemmatimonadaceae bacterium]NUS99034.1 DUF1851 domain-containing protein [Gemmatimonadaceae bacterium]